MIDHELRARGVGASQVAGVLGLDPRTDAFAIYAEKTGMVPRVDNPTERMVAGKRFEEPIAQWYSVKAGVPVQWFDRTLAHPQRSWQVFSADAWVLKGDATAARTTPIREYGDIATFAVGGTDSKMVSYDQADGWGPDGSDEVPERVALQAQYSCSAADLPYWDIAAAFSMTELRIYRIHRDAEIEAIVLDAIEDFWVNHVLKGIPPAPGPSPATADVLRRRYPRSVQPLRCATAEEYSLIERLRKAKAEFKVAENEKLSAEAAIKLAIGDAGGLLAGDTKITWTKNADTIKPDYRGIARELGLRMELVKPVVERALLNEAIRRSDASKALVRTDSDGGELCQVRDMLPPWWTETMPELEKRHEVVTKVGARVLRTPRSWGSEG